MVLLLAALAGAGQGGPPELSGGYFGHLLAHPGVFVGLERPLVAGPHHAAFADGRVGVYHHVRHHTGLFLRGDLGYRATAAFGLYAEALVGLGVHHAVLAGPVYVERDGALRAGVDLGRPAVMPGAALAAGYTLRAEGGWPDRVFLRADAWALAPVNGGALPSGALSAGVAWLLGPR